MIEGLHPLEVAIEGFDGIGEALLYLDHFRAIPYDFAEQAYVSP